MNQGADAAGDGRAGSHVGSALDVGGVVDVDQVVDDLRTALPDAPVPDEIEDCLRQLRAVEELKNVLSARQAELTVAAHDSQRSRDRARGIDEATTARLAGSQVALARRASPHRGSRLLGIARAVVNELPQVRAAMRRGVIGEWQATLVCRETAFLSQADRRAVDEAIGPQLGEVADRRLGDLARAHAYRLDPAAAVARRSRAESERRVSLRPAPDCMTLLTALLPVKDGVACFAALDAAARIGPPADESSSAAADSAHLAPDLRTRAQRMADTFVERLTGRSVDEAPAVRVNLLMPLDALVGSVPAAVPGFGPVPAQLTREMIGLDSANVQPTAGQVQLRRLFTHPTSGDIVAMDSRSRAFPGALAELIRMRDQTCRTPWCGAPIRHLDHITAYASGGATTERNGQGLCERCNYVKQHPDHQVIGDASETRTVAAGLVATSVPPAPPGLPPPARSRVERALIDIEWRHAVGPWRSRAG